MASPLQFAFRTQKAIGVFDADPVYEDLPGFVGPEGNLRCCAYSPCGRYFAWATNEVVGVVDASVGHLLATIPAVNVYELGFSPLGTFISTWERSAKDEAGDATKNLKVWRTIEELGEGQEKKPVGRFVQKSQSNWNLQYTADESRCARQVTNEVQFYESGDLGTVWNKLRVEGVSEFALAPGPDHAVAVFIPGRQGQPAAVKIFNVPQFSNPVSQKTFFKGDKVQFKWNQKGTSLIVLAQTEVDKSNKSYYGETTLYLLSVNGSFDARISLDKEGPIHDVSWSPNSKEFGVVYGYMPAKTTIFNQRAVAMHTFALGPRNSIIFSPSGRFVLVAGFGNLAGSIDVYDLEKDFAKVTTIESGNPSVCQWSPDSRFIMTATTSPRLRVDNGVRIYHVGGAVTYVQDMTELYNIVWRPTPTTATGDPLSIVPVPHASAAQYLGTIKTPSKPAGAYRPPGARGTMTPIHFKREDEGGAAHSVSNGTPQVGPNGFGRSRRQVPGAELAEPVAVPGGAVIGDVAAAGNGDENLSKAALKNKKKRGNKKAKEAEGRGDVDDTNGGAPLDGLVVPSGPARDRAMAPGHYSRSPDRRGPQQHSRNQSRNKIHGPQSRNRSNTQRDDSNQRGGTPLYQPSLQAPPGLPSRPVVSAAADPVSLPPTEPLPTITAESPQASADAKKIRSLQKKLRAIEDLEMRFAGGEKLEDTQVKKISTKSAVARELEALEREA